MAAGGEPGPASGGEVDPAYAPSSLAGAALAVLAAVYTLYFAADLLIPIAAAILLNLLLSPLVRQLARLRVPPPVSAGVLVGGVVMLLGLAFYALAQPAADWMSRGPAIVAELQDKIEQIKQPVRKLQKAAETVEKATDMEDTTGDRQEVTVDKPGILVRVLDVLQDIGVYLGVTLFLLIFLLAGGDSFKEKLVRIAPRLQDKKHVILLMRQVESDVATYLGTVTAINACLGLAIGTAMYLVGLPNAVLWGAMAMALNFIPYLGGAVGAAAVFGAGLISFDTLEQALAAPALYALLNGLEGSIITPAILGRRLTLSPVVVFVALIFWGWIWGVAGALMAVPLLVMLKVVAEHIEKLNPLSELLSHRSRAPAPAAAAPAVSPASERPQPH